MGFGTEDGDEPGRPVLTAMIEQESQPLWECWLCNAKATTAGQRSAPACRLGALGHEWHYSGLPRPDASGPKTLPPDYTEHLPETRQSYARYVLEQARDSFEAQYGKGRGEEWRYALDGAASRSRKEDELVKRGLDKMREEKARRALERMDQERKRGH